MKTLSLTAAILVAGGFVLLSGCGKSAEERSAEAALNDKIMKGHEAQMAMAKKTEGLLAQLDSVIAETDSLIAARPNQGFNKSGLIAARDRLVGSRNAMESWMQNHTPYNQGIKHDLAMAQLQSDLNALQQVQEQMDTAVSDVTRALAEQRQWKDSLMTSMKGRKK